MTSIDLQAADKVVAEAIADGAFPGACYAVGHEGSVSTKAFGRFMYCEESNPVQTDTVWDLASVSKVVGTTTAAMLMVDAGKLDLDAPVARTIPEFGANGKGAITVRNLLMHDSGLAAFHAYQRQYRKASEVLDAIYADPLAYPTGTKTVYSDLGIISLAKVIERVSGSSLDNLLRDRVFGPLGMRDTMYNPPEPVRRRCAPTETVEPWRAEVREMRGLEVRSSACPHAHAQEFIQGEVHDPNAMLLGGVAGHAGLFSTAGDLAVFLTMLLHQGRHADLQLIQPATVDLFTKRVGEGSTRALGWDTKSAEGSSAGTKFSMRSFGHTGYTGTCVWTDPEHRMFGILLANRVHPTSENLKISQVRPRFFDAIATAAGL